MFTSLCVVRLHAINCIYSIKVPSHEFYIIFITEYDWKLLSYFGLNYPNYELSILSLIWPKLPKLRVILSPHFAKKLLALAYSSPYAMLLELLLDFFVGTITPGNSFVSAPDPASGISIAILHWCITQLALNPDRLSIAIHGYPYNRHKISHIILLLPI